MISQYNIENYFIYKGEWVANATKKESLQIVA